MKYHGSNKIVAGIVFVTLLYFTNIIEAANTRYFFNGKYFKKNQSIHGQVQKTTLCNNVIPLEGMDISKLIIDSDENYVSSDEKYFVFQGKYGRHAEPQWFLVDINKCMIVNTIFYNDPEYRVYDYRALFSPDSTKLYITWEVGSDEDETTKTITKEFSGSLLGVVRALNNVVIPDRARNGKGFYLTNYKFSYDGKFLVTYDDDLLISVYQLINDLNLASFNIQDYLGQKKYYENEYLPDINNSAMLFTFKTETGSEMDIFDYTNKKLIRQINVTSRGIGMFSTDAKRIILVGFPNSEWKKEVIVYDSNSGASIGKTTLDETCNIIDVTSDDKQIIYRQNETELRSGLSQ